MKKKCPKYEQKLKWQLHSTRWQVAIGARQVNSIAIDIVLDAFDNLIHVEEDEASRSTLAIANVFQAILVEYFFWSKKLMQCKIVMA